MDQLKEKVSDILKQVKDPELGRDLVSLGMVREVGVDGETVFIHLEVPTPGSDLANQIQKSVEDQVGKLPGVKKVSVQLSSPVRRGPAFQPKLPLPGIRHVVAVASGKGGVGKTTTAVNLALALHGQGYKTGLMDGDIYGPNVPLMLGVRADQRPEVSSRETLIPVEAQGIKMISMGILVPPDQPMVWRGPMLHSAVTQFLQKVEWGELDYLIVDLPPGTGDVQLSLVQTVSLTGAVVVTTPQEVSLMDVRKAVQMFRKTEIPILGVIENMAGEIFGSGGGEKAAAEFSVPFLARIPLEPAVREGGDAGKPVVLSKPDSAAAQSFKQAAARVETGIEELVSGRIG